MWEVEDISYESWSNWVIQAKVHGSNHVIIISLFCLDSYSNGEQGFSFNVSDVALHKALW